MSIQGSVYLFTLDAGKVANDAKLEKMMIDMNAPPQVAAKKVPRSTSRYAIL